jgi:hypothetical protein
LDCSATDCRKKALENVTKVIFEWTDEWGGCGNAHPAFAEGLTEEKKPAGKGAVDGIQEGVERHGSRSPEQSFGDLRREQPE